MHGLDKTDTGKHTSKKLQIESDAKNRQFGIRTNSSHVQSNSKRVVATNHTNLDSYSQFGRTIVEERVLS